MASRSTIILVLLATSILWKGHLFAQETPIYSFDPALLVAAPPRATISAGPAAIVEKDDDEVNIRLRAEEPITPYLDIERGPELSPEELRLLPEEEVQGGLANYKIEAGVGLLVEDNASVNLGYRFRDNPSLLGERHNDPLSLSGDLRISFDLKVPF